MRQSASISALHVISALLLANGAIRQIKTRPGEMALTTMIKTGREKQKNQWAILFYKKYYARSLPDSRPEFPPG
jgi:hypothetical protein